MKKLLVCFCLILFVFTFSCNDGDDPSSPSTPTPSIPVDDPILINGSLVTGFGMGVDDSQQLRNWVSSNADRLMIQYPGGLDWGAVFITVGGDPVPPPRPSQDFSQNTRLAIEMKGVSGGECVQVGIKDANDPDDGTETKRSVSLTVDWNTYEFNLSDFRTCELSQVYVVTEFVFPCSGQNTAQTVEVRTIGFRR